MLVESKLAAWISAGLELYKSNPLMIEPVFYESSQTGFPSYRAPGRLDDTEKLWLADEWAGGRLRWAGEEFPILSNTAQQLTVEGDPSLIEPVGDYLCYQILPPAVAILTELFATEKFTVLTSFAQVPTQFPAFTLRLQSDAQADTYIGDSLKTYATDDGMEFAVRSQAITGSYLISIWTVNREATLFLYAWLMTYALQSMGQFATWGLYDVALSGSDLDPALQYLAERTYTRHLLFTCTRQERAVTTRNAEWVSGLCVRVLMQYATLHTTLHPAMD